MQSTLRLGHLLNKKSSFVYHFGDRTYKIFTPKGKTYRIAELNGNRDALTTKFWQNQVIKVSSFLFCLGMIRGRPLLLNEKKKAEEFVAVKLRHALSYPTQPIFQDFDFSPLRALHSMGLDKNLIDQAEEILSGIYLPATSAHGDLHINNMISVGQEIRIIDWSMFSKGGSFVTDYIHFHNYNIADQKGESWAKSILEDQEYLKELAEVFKTTPNHLRLAYSISRISGEIRQTEDLTQVPVSHIQKFNQVLTCIISKFGKANVQCSNTIV